MAAWRSELGPQFKNSGLEFRVPEQGFLQRFRYPFDCKEHTLTYTALILIFIRACFYRLVYERVLGCFWATSAEPDVKTSQPFLDVSCKQIYLYPASHKSKPTIGARIITYTVLAVPYYKHKRPQKPYSKK